MALDGKFSAWSNFLLGGRKQLVGVLCFVTYCIFCAVHFTLH